jgi:MFS family permease
MVCYISPILGALILSSAGLLWHFWLAQVLFAGLSASISVGAALVTDISPPDILGRALGRYNSANWIGGVIGYTCAGLVIQLLGLQSTFLAAAALPALAILVVFFNVKPQSRAVPQTTNPIVK